MKRIAIGVFLLIHGLAHAGVGLWAVGRGPTWLVTILWLIALLGFLSAGFALLGIPLFSPRRARGLIFAAAVASAILLALVGSAVRAGGLALDLLIVGIAASRPDLFLTDQSMPARPRRLARTLASALVVYIGAVLLLRPWYTTWGTSAADRHLTLPGDAAVPGARYHIDHAVTIAAPADSVWPWIAQIGQDRAGFYSYDWLERAFGDHVDNVDSIVPAWQHRERGDLVRAAQPGYLGGLLGEEPGWRVAELEPGRAMVLEGWGAFVVLPVDAHTSRLYVRTRGDGRPSAAGVALGPFGLLVFEPAHFIMQRRMLLTVKALAERGAQRRMVGDARR